MGLRYRRMEAMIRNRGLVWRLMKSCQKGERLNQKL